MIFLNVTQSKVYSIMPLAGLATGIVLVEKLVLVP